MFKLYSFKSVNDRRENKGEISLVCIIIKKKIRLISMLNYLFEIEVMLTVTNEK